MDFGLNYCRIFLDESLLIDITNTTLETGDTSTMVTGSSEPDSTTENLTTLTTLTTLTPGKKAEAGSEDLAWCENNVCRNGGTCLTSIDGFQCHCRYLLVLVAVVVIDEDFRT